MKMALNNTQMSNNTELHKIINPTETIAKRPESHEKYFCILVIGNW